MSTTLCSRSGRGASRLLYALGILATLGLAAPAHAVTATSTASTYEFDTVPLGAATAANAPVTFGNAIFVQTQIGAATNQALVGPGHGFKPLNYGGGATFARGFLGTIPFDSGNVVDPGGEGDARSRYTTYNTFYGGGGIAIVRGTHAHDNNVNGTATVNITSVAAAFQNLAPAPILLQSGAWFAFSGFMPTGAYGSVSITASLLIPGTGQTAALPNLVFAIDGAGGGNDFVQANGLDSTVNGANPSIYGLSETVVVPGGFNFAVYGISYGPKALFPALSGPADVFATVSIVSDPMATIDWDPGILPPGLNLPDYGPNAIPEPATVSLLLLGAGAVTFAGVRRKRRV